MDLNFRIVRRRKITKAITLFRNRETIFREFVRDTTKVYAAGKFAEKRRRKWKDAGLIIE